MQKICKILIECAENFIFFIDYENLVTIFWDDMQNYMTSDPRNPYFNTTVRTSKLMYENHVAVRTKLCLTSKG
jgi:hypothetical protein